MARNEHIDTLQKEFDEQLRNLTVEKLYTKTCAECGVQFNAKIKLAQHCGTCNSVANVLLIHYTLLTQRWGLYVANPNKIVERVFNAQTKQKRTILQN